MTRLSLGAAGYPLAIFLSGLASASSVRGQIPEAIPIPDEHRAAVSLAEKLGHAIFERDRAAWVGTDALLARHPDAQRRVRGWIVIPDSAGWSVHFIAYEGGEEVYAYRVSLDREFEPREVYEHTSRESLEGDHHARYRARQLAVESTTLRCSTNYNTVVLPASLIDEAGWLVYLLPASVVPGEQYLGHHRVVVDANGTAILRNEALSVSCLRTPPPPPDAVFAVVTHLISPTPIEIHVFRSLATDHPLMVLAGANMWSVTDGTIAFHGPLE